MTAMKPVLDFIVDANILFALAFCLWLSVHSLVRLTLLKHDFFAQLQLLKVGLLLTALSPVLAFAAVKAGQLVWPGSPITVSDIAVAAYLRGDIALPATEFEALLDTRDRWVDAIVSGEFPLLTALITALCVGAFLHLCLVAKSVLAVRKAIARSYVWRRTAKVDIRLSDTISVPFAARGIKRRHIVLPSHLVTQTRQFRFILAHESQHIRAGDAEWEMAFELLRPAMYCNPAFIIWKRRFERLRELACDQAVIHRRGISLREYADCLLDFCTRRVTEPMPRAVHVAFVRRGAKRELLDRLMSLQTSSVRRHWAAVPALAICLVIGVSFTAASVRQPGDWSQDRLMLSSIINLERFNAIQRTPLN